MNYFVNIISGPNAGQRRALTDHAILVVGRGEDCDLRLYDPSVSRVHARITLLDGRVYLEDAGSRWGTLVNGMPTESRELFPGDRVEIGDTQLRLEADSPLVTTIAPDPQAHSAKGSPVAARPPQRRRNGTHRRARRRSRVHPQPARAGRRANRPRRRSCGKKFLRYRVESIVARPRSGIMFPRRDPRYDRPIALENLPARLLPGPRRAPRVFCGPCGPRFRLSTKTWSACYAAGRTRGLCFTASEFVDGESVSQMIRRIGVAGMLDWRNAWHIAQGVAERSKSPTSSRSCIAISAPATSSSARPTAASSWAT